MTLEIETKIPSGVPGNVVRTVTDNGRTPKFASQGFCPRRFKRRGRGDIDHITVMTWQMRSRRYGSDVCRPCRHPRRAEA